MAPNCRIEMAAIEHVSQEPFDRLAIALQRWLERLVSGYWFAGREIVQVTAFSVVLQVVIKTSNRLAVGPRVLGELVER